jgi:hypothetical protein
VLAFQNPASQAACTEGGGDIDEATPIGGASSAVYNLSRPASYSFTALLFGDDAHTEASRAYTESLPPSAAPSIRNSGEPSTLSPLFLLLQIGQPTPLDASLCLLSGKPL